MRKSICLVGFCCLAVLTAMRPGRAGVTDSDKNLDVSFAMQESKVSLHEPVVATFSVKNRLTETIRFDLGFNRQRNFEFIITNPDGPVDRRIQITEIGGMAAPGKISLGPNETYSQNLLLDEWYRFITPGKYKVEAKLIGSIHTESGTVVKTNPTQEMLITVGPRNIKRLKDVCQRLTDTACRSTGVQRGEAALALSYVRDPVAIPYLDRLMREGKTMRRVAPRGLGRIGTPEALELLRAHLKTADPELKTEIAGVLYEIRTGRRLLVTD